MTRQPSEGSRPLWAVVVLAAFALHAAHKLEHGLLAEMLWACHVASLSIGLGILLRRIWLVAVGTLFHVAVGIPAYVLDVIVLGTTTFTSVLIHTLPPLAGLVVLRRDGPWPRWTPLAAASLYLALIPLSRWLTEPALNVNLAFRPWPPLAGLAMSPWLTWLGNAVGMAVVLPLFDGWLRRWSARYRVEGAAFD
ncbi:MAG TPA: hypothetical protein VFU02_00355 [Polyangiaceae bacterium]|nr:hypothetical protein [Polyangiaceae bacterium]